MKSLLKIVILIIVVVALVSFVRSTPSRAPASASQAKETKQLQVVKFGMLPYGDHTQAIIGVKQGWFADVGIDLKPELIKIENGVSFLKNGTLDVCSLPLGLLYPAYDSASDLGTFVFCDLFQGFAIMAQPDKGYRSYQEFLADGMTSEQAFKAAIGQMRGKTFAYPSETAIKPFIDVALEKGGLTREDLTSLVQDDALTINAMRAKQADFQVGGAPSHIILQREGFKVIVSAIDLAKSATTESSKELACVFPDGWSTTKQMYDQHRDTLLRLASVSFRINDFITKHPEEALAIHMPYLSKATGEKFTPEDGKIIYDSLDPFPTFSEQNAWFHDTNSPFYYKRINGVALQTFIDKGVFRGKIPTVDEFIYADNIYFDLEHLKAESEELFNKIESTGIAKQGDKAPAFAEAKRQYEHFNYYDSARLARELLGSK